MKWINVWVRMAMVMGTLSVSLAAAQAPFIDPNYDLSGLWEQVKAQPDDFGAACLPLNNPQAAVYYNADEPFPLASVSKVLILIEYARQIESGAISQDEQVSLAALNQYDLPRTNAGEHEAFLATYPEGTESISLWDVATEGMIQYSSNAAADYVLARLAPVDWTSLYALLGITHTTEPYPLTLIPLLMNNHVSGRQTRNTVGNLSLEQAQDWYTLYVSDEAWREAEIDYRAARRRSFPDWDVQATILQDYTAVGTAADLLKVMTAIYGTGGVLSEDVKWIVRTALRWKDNEAISNSYFEYGSKLGFYSGGVLTLIAFGHPYQGEPVISVMFLRNLSRQTYNAFLREDLIGNLAHWLNFNACSGLIESVTP